MKRGSEVRKLWDMYRSYVLYPIELSVLISQILNVAFIHSCCISHCFLVSDAPPFCGETWNGIEFRSRGA